MLNAAYALLSHDWAGLVIGGAVAAVGLLLLMVGRRVDKTAVRVTAYLALGAAALAGIGSLYHLRAMATIRAEHPVPGRLVDVGGYRVHVLAEGDARGRPPVIWLPGGHAAGYAVHHLHRVVRAEMRSILVDRPGTGWSDPGPFPRTTAREAGEVAAALAGAGETGPFILAGHSFGGLLAANIARRSPELVAGLILLDATPPDTINYAPENPLLEQMRRGAVLEALRRLLSFHPESAAPPPADGGAETLLQTIRRELGPALAALEAVESGPKSVLANASIFAELSPGGMGWNEVVYDGELGDLPVFLVAPGTMGDDEFRMVVAALQAARGSQLSAAETARLKNFYLASRERYLAISSNARRIHAPHGTGHNFPYEAPGFVVDIVRQMIGVVAESSYASIAADDSRLDAMTLADGHTLAWAEYGDPSGVPVIELHGGGASHLSGLVYHREALDAGVRIIAVDRPGAGGSAPKPNFAVATFHRDIEQLAEHIGLRRFVVMGNSNGGMFAIALAHALPDRVAGAIPLNPATPVFDDPEALQMTPLYRELAGQDLDEIVSGMRQTAARYRDDPDSMRANDPFKQFPATTEPEIVDLYFESIRLTPEETFKLEVGFVLDERGWGFDVFDIRPRVEFFTGEHEIGTPYNRVWVSKLPNAALHLMSGGHMGQTAPETRRRIMHCAAALYAGRHCEPGPRQQ